MRLTVVTKGRIGLTDEIAFVAAGAAPIPRVAAHRVSLKRYQKHSKWAFRDPTTHALEPVYSVNYNDMPRACRARRPRTTWASRTTQAG